MQTSQVEPDQQLDRCIQHALRAEPYPTNAQRAEGWEAVRTRAAAQAMLPAYKPAIVWHVWARHVAQKVLSAVWSSRTMLTEESAFRRAQREDTSRATAWARTPYGHFQPMW